MSSSSNQPPLDTTRFIARHVAGLRRSGIRDFFELVAKTDGVISLGIGEPDFDTPEPIRNAVKTAMDTGKTHYTSNLGQPDLRKEISRYVEGYFHVPYSWEDEILVTVGVSEALDLALRALLNPGDKVLYHQPCYVSYAPTVELVHGVGVPVATSAAEQFSLDEPALRAAWQPGCKLLLLNLPCNPTGGVCSKEQLERIAKFAIEKDLIVISDEIYSELIFEGTHTSIASLPGMRERTLLLHGFSKAFAMTGFRLGYACGPAPLIEAMMKVHQYSMLCAPSISQEGALAALRLGDDATKFMRDRYRERRDLFVRRINAAGIKCHAPRGSFYAFPSIVSTGLDEGEFARRLLTEFKVAVVPGTAFGDAGKGHVRACFTANEQKLNAACDRIEQMLASLGRSKASA
ncbi:aminotransferase class I/II-fold pyridoxal phosphate-dependent enzyme [Oleiharenicola lentus]|jgi:aminotransferase|uniref:Aminotransferase n=1 Tax=Oleiharenicola lentus TaxID=2508720 RepID=A0A4Q1C962_9BACT|nr:aminotransferase class I/II-fold pyridoxal phosphate-dependent enzyme [Oleiharenicola lentus]RXK55478.1 aminotransferase class I/II-fold pyridoxal phosphate-dependent enzyme [Oleiharenicola lentus]